MPQVGKNFVALTHSRAASRRDLSLASVSSTPRVSAFGASMRTNHWFVAR